MSMTQNFKSDFKSGSGMHRLRDNSTGLWLHMDARSPTASKDWSWSGTPQQARTLEQQAIRDDKPWPYTRAPMEEVNLDADDAATIT